MEIVRTKKAISKTINTLVRDRLRDGEYPAITIYQTGDLPPVTMCWYAEAGADGETITVASITDCNTGMVVTGTESGINVNSRMIDCYVSNPGDEHAFFAGALFRDIVSIRVDCGGDSETITLTDPPPVRVATGTVRLRGNSFSRLVYVTQLAAELGIDIGDEVRVTLERVD